MGITHHLVDGRLIYTNWIGLIADQELILANEKRISNAPPVSGVSQLIDTRNADLRNVSSQAMIKWAELVNLYFKKNVDRNIHAPKQSIAVLAPEDVTFGLFRLHEQYLEGTPIDTKIFRTKDKAFEWLGYTQHPTDHYLQSAPHLY